MSKMDRYDYKDVAADSGGEYYLATDIDPILKRMALLEKCAEAAKSLSSGCHDELDHDLLYERHNELDEALSALAENGDGE